MVGTSGRNGNRSLLATASGFSRPARISWSADGIGVNITGTWPPTMSVIAGPAPPLYGTCTMSRFATPRNSSISSRFRLPLPGEAKLILVGFLRPYSTSSATLFAGMDGPATRMSGAFATCDTGAKLTAVILCCAPKIDWLIASVPTLPRKTV